MPAWDKAGAGSAELGQSRAAEGSVGRLDLPGTGTQPEWLSRLLSGAAYWPAGQTGRPRCIGKYRFAPLESPRRLTDPRQGRNAWELYRHSGMED